MSWNYNEKEDKWEEINNPYEFEHEQVEIYYQGTKNIYYKGERHQGYRSPNGNGIIYWQNGNKRYEGTFILGTLKQGKAYFENGSLQYEGEMCRADKLGKPSGFSNQVPHGVGKLYDEEGKLIYSGRFVEGKTEAENARFDFWNRDFPVIIFKALPIIGFIIFLIWLL